MTLRIKELSTLRNTAAPGSLKKREGQPPSFPFIRSTRNSSFGVELPAQDFRLLIDRWILGPAGNELIAQVHIIPDRPDPL